MQKKFDYEIKMLKSMLKSRAFLTIFSWKSESDSYIYIQVTFDNILNILLNIHFNNGIFKV